MRWISLFLKMAGALALAFSLTLLFLLLLSPWTIRGAFTLASIASQNIAFLLAAILAWKWWIKSPLSEMGWTAPHPWVSFWKGTGIGLGLIGGLSLVLAATPWFAIESIGWGSQTAYSIGFAIVAFLLVSVGEEVFTRGFVQSLFIRHVGVGAGILATSLLFSALHLTNPYTSALSLFNLFLAGIMLGAARVASGNLWVPIGLHFSWNWSQEMLSIPVSGLQLTPEPPLVLIDSGPDWITGGPFGLEGGLGATLVMLAVTTWYIRQMRSRSILLWSQPNS
ncbi:CPBP family intramembrane glutamic endopeptidase [Desmospora profundinema]|uniref:Membrane protease YdiL (CAAX protease family) n=1 Tax=Desmospora profundinema TaxID=1571184 RepID=A0ABU1IKE7_9BACL|nr:CPBP family intramembrane glutamic endopeptidase [Desmospora profundinema]MDR6225238.1 membrane protease YdiL (CAAX protease family) [Desmospora profundinema]